MSQISTIIVDGNSAQLPSIKGERIVLKICLYAKTINTLQLYVRVYYYYYFSCKDKYILICRKQSFLS